MVRRYLFCLAVMMIIQSTGAAISAPYLTGASALSDTEISISWRNNSFATRRFIIFRKSSTDLFSAIDTVSDTVQSFNDSPLQKLTAYCYRMIACSDSAVSDSSNEVCATTLDHDTTTVIDIRAPHIALALDTAAGKVHVTIYDSSRGEDGYRLYRKEQSVDTFNLIQTIISNSPSNYNTLLYIDSSVLKDKRYSYYADGYKGSNSNNYGTWNNPDIFVYDPPKLDSIKFNLVSRMPLYKFSGWAQIINDTVFIKETVSTGSGFSIINTSDPNNPAYLGPASGNVIKLYDSLYGIVDSGLTVFRNDFPYLYWWSNFGGMLHLSVNENGRYRRIDSIYSTTSRYQVAMTSNFIVFSNHSATTMTDPGYDYPMIADRYHLSQKISASFYPGTTGKLCIAGDSNIIITYENYSPLFDIYNVYDNGKGIAYHYTSSWTNGGIMQDPFHRYFFYPYFFQIDPNAKPYSLEVVDVRQANNFSVLGKLAISTLTNKLLFDTKRNLLLIFTSDTLSIYSINANIKQHVAVKQHRQSKPLVLTSGIRILKTLFRILKTLSNLSIAIPEACLPADISLYTMSGRRIISFKNIQQNKLILSVQDLSNGIYLLQANGGMISDTKKIIIKKQTRK
jgi:hypothetical protein